MTGFTEKVPVFCKNGWTLIMSRGQYGNPGDFFDRTWAEMEQPFGSPDEEFWLGLSYIHKLTNAGSPYTIKFELLSPDGNYSEAFYSDFKLTDDMYYPLHYGSFMATESTAGNSWAMHKNMKFSTYDSDNDLYLGGKCTNNHPGPNW